MRKTARGLFILMLAYLLQTAVLPYLKVGGVILDVITIALLAVGYCMGAYAAVVGGLLVSLWMEALTGELGGFTTVVCLTTSSVGAYAAHRLGGFSRAGKRGFDRFLRWFAPIAIIGLLVIVREGIHVVYFYLTGVEIRAVHFFRAGLAGILASAFAVPLLPLIKTFVLRKREDTFLAKRMKRRKDKKKPAPVELSLPAREIIAVHEPIILDAEAWAGAGDEPPGPPEIGSGTGEQRPPRAEEGDDFTE